MRDLISVDDVMEASRPETGVGMFKVRHFHASSPRKWKELDYGPNGGLVYAMEYLSENMSWLEASGCSPLDLADLT